jgi:hypothetical protein
MWELFPHVSILPKQLEPNPGAPIRENKICTRKYPEADGIHQESHILRNRTSHGIIMST